MMTAKTLIARAFIHAKENAIDFTKFVLNQTYYNEKKTSFLLILPLGLLTQLKGPKREFQVGVSLHLSLKEIECTNYYNAVRSL